MIDHAEVVQLIKDRQLVVYHDNVQKVHFIMYQGLRCNLTQAEADEVHAPSEHGEAWAIALLHGWDSILRSIGVKSGI